MLDDESASERLCGEGVCVCYDYSLERISLTGKFSVTMSPD